MVNLHARLLTVNKSPYTHTSLESCLQFAAKGDKILLIEDGVLAAEAGTAKSVLIEQPLAVGLVVYALDADLKAQSVKTVSEGVRTVNYDGRVDLLEQDPCRIGYRRT